MNQITCCPHCSVWYRVTPELLARAGGLVRCGRCGETFDAREHLWTPEEGKERGNAGRAPDRPAAAQTVPREEEPEEQGPEAEEESFSPPAFPETDHRLGNLDDPGLEGSFTDPATTAVDQALSAVDEPFTIPRVDPLIRNPSPPQPRRRRGERLPWILGTLFLAALLVASLSYLRPWKAWRGAPAKTGWGPGAGLASRSDPRAFRITAAEVVISRHHPRTGLVVAGTLLNTTKKAEPLPWLLVRITDVAGRTVAAGAFLPGDYERKPAPDLPGKTATPFRLRVLAPSHAAAGFRIELCRGFPPHLLCR